MGKKWYKFYDKDVPQKIEIPEIPLYEFLLKSAKDYPYKTACVFYDKKYSYKFIRDSALKFSNFLKKLNFEKGDKLALILPNTPEFIISYYGTLMKGGICVQLNPLLSDREIEILLNDSEARGVCILDILIPKFWNAIRNSKCKFVIITEIKPYLPFLKKIGLVILKIKKGVKDKINKLGKKIYEFKDVKNEELLKELTEVNPREDIACLQYTGGTTGIPKGSMLTHYNLVANTLQASAWVSDLRKGEEVVMGVLPFFHVYGMSIALNLSIANALTLIIVPKFHIKEVLELLEKYKVTIFPGVPQMYQAINSYENVKKYNLKNIRVCISGAAPLPAVVKEKFEKITGAKLVEGYGLSEASPVTHCNPIYGLNKKGSIGVPFPSTEAKIVDIEKGEKEMPVGEPGELIIRGPQVMKGYWKRPEETKKVLRNGWLYTGDIAKMDEDGYFYILDRKKDLIIVSGFNVYPRNVEEVLLRHPAVKDVACVGIPSERTGEAVKVFIVLKEGEKLTKEEIVEFCKKNLAKYEVPQEVEFVEKIPKTIIGKVLRRVLRERK